MVDPRNITLKFGQKRLSNRGDAVYVAVAVIVVSVVIVVAVSLKFG